MPIYVLSIGDTKMEKSWSLPLKGSWDWKRRLLPTQGTVIISPLEAQPKHAGSTRGGGGEGKREQKLLIPAVSPESRWLINQIVNNVMVNVSNVFLKASKHFIAFDPSSNKALHLCQVVSACHLTWVAKSTARPTRGKGGSFTNVAHSNPMAGLTHTLANLSCVLGVSRVLVACHTPTSSSYRKAKEHWAQMWTHKPASVSRVTAQLPQWTLSSWWAFILLSLKQKSWAPALPTPCGSYECFNSSLF